MNRILRLFIVLLFLGVGLGATTQSARARAVNDLCFPYTPKNADKAATTIHLFNPNASTASFMLNLYSPNGTNVYTYRADIPSKGMNVLDFSLIADIPDGSYQTTVFSPSPLDGVAYVRDTANGTLGVYEGQECARNGAIVQYFGPFFVNAGGSPASSLLLANSQAAPANVAIDFLTAAGVVGYSEAGVSLGGEKSRRWDTAEVATKGAFPNELAWVRVSGTGAASVTGVIRQQDGNGLVMYHAAAGVSSSALTAAGPSMNSIVFVPRIILDYSPVSNTAVKFRSRLFTGNLIAGANALALFSYMGDGSKGGSQLYATLPPAGAAIYDAQSFVYGPGMFSAALGSPGALGVTSFMQATDNLSYNADAYFAASTSGAQSIFLPSVLHQQTTASLVSIQNGSGSPTDVRITLRDQAGAVVTEQTYLDLRAGAAFSFDMRSQPDFFVGSLEVTATAFDGLIVGQVDVFSAIKPPAPQPPLARNIVFVQGIDSEGNCSGANKWLQDYLDGSEGSIWSSMVKIAKYLHFNYRGGGSYACPSSGLAYEKLDTCDGINNAAWELKRTIMNSATASVVIVAHSMGGLVAARMVTMDPEWSRSHVAGVVTLDSPVRGVWNIGAFLKGAVPRVSDCDDKAYPGTGESSISGLKEGSTVVLTAARAALYVPFFAIDATETDYGIQVADRALTRLDNSRPFYPANRCGTPKGPTEPYCEPPFSVTDSHSQVWNRRWDGRGTDKAFLLGCAASNIYGCYVDQIFLKRPAVSAAQTVASSTQFDVTDGVNTLRVVSSFAGGGVRMRISAPSGASYGPDGAGAVAGYAVDTTSEVYDLASPEPGLWTITVDATEMLTQDLPVTIASLIVDMQPLQAKLPPTAAVVLADTGYVGSSTSFSASGSYDADGAVTQYEWDIDGDGTYDATSESGVLTYSYPSAFNGYIGLRVTDTDGLQATARAAVDIRYALFLPTLKR